MKTGRILVKYALTLLVLILLGLGFLYLAGLLPQQPIREHLAASLYQFQSDEAMPQVSDDIRWSDRMDIYSEHLMLTHAFYMNTREDPTSIAANPGYLREDSSTWQGFLTILSEPTEPNFYYARYWMGFRGYLRILLCFLTYPEIRRLNMIVILLLFSLALVKLCRRLRGAVAVPMLLAAAFVLCNPFVILSTLHSGTCFAIAFGGIAFLPKRERRFLSYPMYFFLLGALTQYLDFYTSPLICYALPMTALLLTEGQAEGRVAPRGAFRLAGRCALAWFAAYALFWIGKMGATTLLSDQNGFADAFGSLLFRLGAGAEAAAMPELSYNPLTALARCFARLVLDNLAASMALLGAIGLVWLILFFRRGARLPRFQAAAVYLCVALLPILWFVVAAQPTIIHARFQYRQLAAFLFAGGAFILASLRPPGETLHPAPPD
ncbi:MAG: hypothetical protein Q4C13_03325 [Clostridia bacterium]|nr:hypothetical protein [Clostridia bacterium]